LTTSKQTKSTEVLEIVDGNIDALINHGKRIVQTFEVDGVTCLVYPDDMEVREFRDFLPGPPRIERAVRVFTLESFYQYVNRFSNEESTIFVDKDKGEFIAIIDYHERQSVPRHCTHRVNLTARPTLEWRDWKEIDNKYVTQIAMALFIEDNAADIIEPDGATMLEIATTLSAKTGIDFKRGVRLDNGQVQIKYNETIDGSAGATGELTIPTVVKIAITPFEGAPPYEVTAKFRYRIKEGNLTLCFKLHNPHKIWDAAIKDSVEELREKLNQGHIVSGSY